MKKFTPKTKTVSGSDTVGGTSGPGQLKLNQKITINIAVMGDPKCGKTSLIECFLFGGVSDRYKDTVLNIYQSNITEKRFKIDMKKLTYFLFRFTRFIFKSNKIRIKKS